MLGGGVGETHTCGGKPMMGILKEGPVGHPFRKAYEHRHVFQ